MSHPDQYTLATSDNGCIIACSCCSKIQITFNNIILRYHEEDFIAFKKCIENLTATTNYSPPTQPEKQYFVKLPPKTIFTFNLREYQEFKQLLQEAEASRAVNELIDNHLY